MYVASSHWYCYSYAVLKDLNSSLFSCSCVIIILHFCFVLCVKDMYKKHTGLYIDTSCDTNTKMPSMLTVNYCLPYEVYISTLQLDLVQRSEVVTKDFIVTLCVHVKESALHVSFTYLLTYLLTYSMEQGPSWEANRFWASQEIPHILWNPKVHYRIHTSLPPAPILSQLNPFHGTTSHFLKSILILSTYLCLGLPSGLFPSGFSTKTLYTRLLPYTCYMPRLSHSRFDHPNNTGWGVQIIKLLIM